MSDKIFAAVAGALVGAVMTYGAKAISLEGRLDAMEKTLQRIEFRLFPTTKPP